MIAYQLKRPARPHESLAHPSRGANLTWSRSLLESISESAGGWGVRNVGGASPGARGTSCEAISLVFGGEDIQNEYLIV